MIKNFPVESINQLVKNFMDTLPSALRQCPTELEKNFHQLLENAFNQLNLVTREEFDAQTAVLLRTREKLERLEKHLAEL